MYDTPRQREVNAIVGAHARRPPVDAHEGSAQDWLCRHAQAAREAAPGTRQERREFAPCLLRRTADTRNLYLAIGNLTKGEPKAPGPNGLHLEELTTHEQWELARMLGQLIKSGKYQPGPSRRIDIPKASGNGKRPLDLSNAEDRVVQRAIVQTIQPFVDPRFREESYGFRQGKGREQAIIRALQLSRDKTIWITEDLKDAFTQIPRQRLTQALAWFELDPGLIELAQRTIANPGQRGIPQGSPLSPLLLNTYCHLNLDLPWKRKNPDRPLLRYADDILVISDSDNAQRDYQNLKNLCSSAGMPLKGTPEKAIRNIESDGADWLGFHVTRENGKTAVTIGEASWQKLAVGLSYLHEKPEPALRAQETIVGWISQAGPCYEHENRKQVYGRMDSIARDLSFEETPTEEELHRVWNLAHLRYLQLLRENDLESGTAGGSARVHHDLA